MKNITTVFLLNLMLLLFSCGDGPVPDLCNSQDPESPCYMPPPGPGVMSYNPHSIIISDDSINVENNENVRKLILEKFIDDSNDSDTLIVSVQNGTYEFIDSGNINLGSMYSYNLKFQSYDSTFSEYTFLDPFTHQYNAVDNIEIELINENKADIIWNYNYYENFYQQRDSLNFTLIKEQLSEVDIETSIINLTLAIPNDNSNIYIYQDTTIVPNDILQYTIYMTDEDLTSASLQSEIDTVNFPDCNINHSIPLNSHTIRLKWECDYVIGTLAEIRLSNQWNDELFVIQNAEASGYYTDNLNDYIELINDIPHDDIANVPVNYTLTWVGQGGDDDVSNKIINTFPVHHMEYVPSLEPNTFEYGDEDSENGFLIEIDTLSRAFYIDKYEISNELFDNPASNPYDKWASTPYEEESAGVNYNEAIDFCEDRSDFYQELGITFELPNELDWEIAASAKYSKDLILDPILNIFTSSSTDKLFYPESVGDGQINCVYANIQSCNNTPLEVGYFSASNGQINSTSPSGVYDFSGNVKEWVIKYFSHEGEPNREILRGGDYNSNPSEVKSTSFIYENPELEHKSIGFRTIIYADTYFDFIRKEGINE